MSPQVCKNKHSCLARRDEVFRRDAIWTRDHECSACVIGTARRMDSFIPEPDVEPQPLRDAGKAKKKAVNKCACGSKIERRAKQCKKCWGLSRRINHAKCSVSGCRCKARRSGLCCTHYFKAQGEEKLERKREKQRAATKKYRDMAHRIAVRKPRQAVIEKMEKEAAQ